MNPQQQGPEIKNLIVAMGLSVAVLLGWEYFIAGPKRDALKRADMAQAEEMKRADGALQPSVPEGAAQTATVPLSREERLSQSSRVMIESPRLSGSINLNGLRIDDLTLKGYAQSVEEGSPPVTLLNPSGPQSYFAEFGWITPSAKIEAAVPSAETPWQTSAQTLKSGGSITAHWDNGHGLRFERRISLDEHYMFTVEERVINTSGAAVTLYPYGLISRQFDDEGQHFFILHEGPLGVFDETLEEVSYEELRDEGEVSFAGKADWLGITDKYWLAALVPDASLKTKSKLTFREPGGKPTYQTDFTGAGQTVAPGGAISLTHKLFAGAKEVGVLDGYAQQDGITLFDRAVDFGWLYFLTKPIFGALDWLNSMLGNFGLAILALTVGIKLVLFPLANKSYKSMSQLKLLMPKIQQIKERHADDKMAMNQEIMKLYQSEKVNPASGCLPMLVQIPIFFALYKVLFVTIEMRHADFYGWVNDLSAPDPTTIFNLFGLLPFDPPSFLMIGAWPVIMCASMIIQMRLNPKPADPAQAMVMQWLPFIFLFLFASFPAGLVIYWAWNNTLSIAQQWFIMKRHGAR